MTNSNNIRIIPRLDIKGQNLIKGVHLEGLKVIGSPQEYATKYYEQGADELIYVDSVASLYGRNHLSEIIQRACANIFIPLTVGGGIRSVTDVRDVLRNGADKVAINTAAVNKPELISEIASAPKFFIASIPSFKFPIPPFAITGTVEKLVTALIKS